MQSNFGPSVLRGVFAHIAERGEWGLEIIRSAQDFTSDTVLDAIRHKVDGILIALNEEPPAAFRALVRSKIPFVTVETYSPTLETCEDGIASFRIDNRLIGLGAARFFATQGRFAAFGYVPYRRDAAWSVFCAVMDSCRNATGDMRQHPPFRQTQLTIPSRGAAISRNGSESLTSQQPSSLRTMPRLWKSCTPVPALISQCHTTFPSSESTTRNSFARTRRHAFRAYVPISSSPGEKPPKPLNA